MKIVYPDINWKDDEFDNPIQDRMSKTQLLLFGFIRELYPSMKGYENDNFLAADIHVNFPHSGLNYSDTKRVMELDIYIPEYRLAFEYQGKQHYMPALFLEEPSVEGRQVMLFISCLFIY